MHFSLLTELIIIFLLSIGVNLLCSKIKLPTTVGFLLTGVLCGPSLLGLVSDKEVIDKAADIGVAMLMFTIGMELSGEALSRLKRPVFLGGSLQIGLITLITWGIGLFFGHPAQGILWGCLLALSSSAIVLQIFQQKGIATTPVGRLSMAILVFQDIMVAPMMILLPLLSGKLQFSPESVLTATLKVAGMGVGMFLFSRFALHKLMEAVVRTRAREILLLTTLCICLGFASITQALGMSLSLGAFLAGLMLARSQYAMSVIADILPYRDVFMSLFFITVGMMLDVSFIIHHAVPIVGLVLVFVLLKTLMTMPAVLIQGYPLRTAIRASLSLAQVGEFSFVLASSGLALGLLDNFSSQMFLTISVITMMLTPGMIAGAPSLSKAICNFLAKLGCCSACDNNEQIAKGNDQKALIDHTIIIGFGFSGKHLAHTCRECHLPYTILEMNPETVRRYRNKEPISYGDASQPAILKHLGIATAKVLAIVISDPSAVRAIVAKAREVNSQVTIIARTRFVTEISPLYKLGANYVVAEEFESALEVFTQVLSSYLVPRQDIERLADMIRRQNYRTIRRLTKTSDDLSSLVCHLPEMSVQALRLGAGSPLCGKSLAETAMRTKYKATVVAAYREGIMYPSPAGDFVMQENDILYIFANMDRIFTIKAVFSGLQPAQESTPVPDMSAQTNQ